MIAAALWSLFAIVIATAVIDGIRHVRMSASEKRASRRRAELLRREAESVPVHADRSNL